MLLGRRHREEDRLRRARVRLIDVKAHAVTCVRAGITPSTRQRRAPRPSPPATAAATRCATIDRRPPPDRPGSAAHRSLLVCRQLTDVERQRFRTSRAARAQKASAPDEDAPSRTCAARCSHVPDAIASPPATRPARRERCGHVRCSDSRGADGIRCKRCDHAGAVILGISTAPSRRSSSASTAAGAPRATQAATLAAALRRQRFPLDRGGKRCSRSCSAATATPARDARSAASTVAGATPSPAA